ncbi:hypothetical protein GT045_24350, partial [Streptomyces sp. SID486]|nr:hypothetical protein [Streptomyces sp. SID486]
MASTYLAGSLVNVRGRDWVVLPESEPGLLVVRPLGGTDDDVAAVLPAVEEVRTAGHAAVPTDEEVPTTGHAALPGPGTGPGERPAAGPPDGAPHGGRGSAARPLRRA